MRARTVIAGLIIMLAACVAAAVAIGLQIDGSISRQGWIAFGLGTGLTILVAAGLMSLIYFSHRRGYDDDAGHP